MWSYVHPFIMPPAVSTTLFLIFTSSSSPARSVFPPVFGHRYGRVGRWLEDSTITQLASVHFHRVSFSLSGGLIQHLMTVDGTRCRDAHKYLQSIAHSILCTPAERSSRLQRRPMCFLVEIRISLIMLAVEPCY